MVSVILLARAGRRPQPAALLAISVWKISLMMVTTICSVAAQGILTFVAARRGSKLAAALYMLAALCAVGMAVMGSNPSQPVALQWLEEITNSSGNIAFAAGSYLLFLTYQKASEEALPLRKTRIAA
jgi:hypothetical protein